LLLRNRLVFSAFNYKGLLFFINLNLEIMQFDFKVETNPNTGEKMLVSAFQGKLVSIATQAVENVKGTSFYPATVEYTNVKGNVVKNGCLVYKANHDYGMSTGTEYLGKIIKVAGKSPLLVLSHLERAGQASDEDFGIDMSMLEVADFDKVAKK
jgi:hypothetical protein